MIRYDTVQFILRLRLTYVQGKVIELVMRDDMTEALTMCSLGTLFDKGESSMDWFARDEFCEFANENELDEKKRLIIECVLQKNYRLARMNMRV